MGQPVQTLAGQEQNSLNEAAVSAGQGKGRCWEQPGHGQDMPRGTDLAATGATASVCSVSGHSSV